MTRRIRNASFPEPLDYIVDAIDLVSCKLSLICTAQERGVPIISAMGTGNKLDPMQFCVTDIYKTSGCHLARILRRELRARGVRRHTVLYSQELPLPQLEQGETPPPKPPSRSRLGLMGAVLRGSDARGIRCSDADPRARAVNFGRIHKKRENDGIW